jgi:hypothetical protein
METLFSVENIILEGLRIRALHVGGTGHNQPRVIKKKNSSTYA